MKKSKIRTKKKNNNNKKIIHQIFFNIGKGELKDIKPFYKCYKHNKEYCKKNNIKYKLWSRKQVEKLLEKPKNKEFKKLYYDFDQDIMRIDFARYLILWNFGGIYIDLDICIMNKSIKSLFEKEYFFVKWNDDKSNVVPLTDEELLELNYVKYHKTWQEASKEESPITGGQFTY